MNKFLYVPLLLATLGATDVALAQTPAASQEAGKVTAGATVLDPKGGTVGTIKEISGEFAVLATDAVEVRLPLSSFAVGPKGPILGMTREQVNQAAGGAASAVDKLLVAGTPVSGLQGAPIGTIEQVMGDNVVVATTAGKATLPRTAFTQGPNGLSIGMSAAQLQAQIAGATAALSAQLVKGTQIRDPQGVLVGTIDVVEGEKATVVTSSGKKVVLPVNALGSGTSGLVVGISAAEIEKTAAGS